MAGLLNVFDKASRKPIRRRTHRNSCGAFNWQPSAFETAFNHIEKHVAKVVELTEEATEADAIVLTGWIALHFIRSPRRAAVLSKLYDAEVSEFQSWLATCGAFVQKFHEKCLLTSDTPVCVLDCSNEAGPLNLLMLPLGPAKAIYISPNDKLPQLKGSRFPLFEPALLNQLVVHGAYREIVSYDNRLHLP